jgi:preprotein translocase subunit SecD
LLAAKACRALVVAAVALLATSGCGHGKKRETFVVRLKAVAAPGHHVSAQDLDRSASIMRERLQKLGVSDADVRVDGGDVIVIELPRGVSATSVRLVGKTALLEFYDFEAHLTGPSVRGPARLPVASESLYRLLAAPQTRRLAKRGASQWYLFDGNRRVLRGPLPQRPSGATALPVPRDTVVVTCNVQVGNCLSVRALSTRTGYYLFKPGAEMTGADLKLSATRADIDPQTNQPVVLIQFTAKGTKIFQTITRREAQRGALVCQGKTDSASVLSCAQHFAIVLDGQIQSAPYIDFVRNPDGIPGANGAQIDMGRGGLSDVKRLALALQTGALPVQFVGLP